MEHDEPRKPAPSDTGEGANPFDTEVGEPERISGEYSFVYHEVARITTVRKSIPARPPAVSGTPSNDGGTRTKK